MVKLAMLHDEYELSTAGDDAVSLHHIESSTFHVPPSQTMAANDYRWLVFEAFIRTAVPQHRAYDDCIVIVDVSDVGMIGNVTRLCEHYPQAIFAASDSCGVSGSRGVKAWLKNQAARANFSLASTPWLQSFLTARHTTVPVVFNCGIMGGRRNILLPFLHAMATGIRAHYSSQPAAWKLVDMLVFNDLVLRRLAEDEEALHQRSRDGLLWNQTVVTGWPLGPLNLPMWSSFCGQDECSRRPNTSALPHAHRSDECHRRLMLRMAPAYFFSHKVPYLQYPLPVRSWTRGY